MNDSFFLQMDFFSEQGPYPLLMNIHVTLNYYQVAFYIKMHIFSMFILENRMRLIIFSKDGQCLLIIGLLFSRGEVCVHLLKLG